MKKVIFLLVCLVFLLFLYKKEDKSLIVERSSAFIETIRTELHNIRQNNQKNPVLEPPTIDFDRLNSNLQEKMADFLNRLEKKESNIKESSPKEDSRSSFSKFHFRNKLRDLPTRVANHYGDIVLSACRESPEEVDPLLIAAIIKVESGFEQRAISPKGAKGLMQLMPVNYRSLGIDPFDPVENIQAGVKIMADNLKRYGGDVHLALAAYNAGPSAVDKHGGIPPYKETRLYVKKVITAHQELQRL